MSIKYVCWLRVGRVMLCAAFLGGFVAHSYAEMRVWTLKDGRQFAGEYVMERLDKLFVRDMGGQVGSFALTDFSESDLKYIRTKIPPEVSISVRKKKQDVELSEYCLDLEKVWLITLQIDVTKISRPRFDGRLSGNVVMVAQDDATKRYFVLHKMNFSPEFLEENRNKFECSTSAKVRTWEEYNWEVRSYDYVGYVLTIFGPSGEVILRETDITRLEEGAVDKIVEYPLFTFFNETGRRQSVPRPATTEERREWDSF